MSEEKAVSYSKEFVKSDAFNKTMILLGLLSGHLRNREGFRVIIEDHPESGEVTIEYQFREVRKEESGRI